MPAATCFLTLSFAAAQMPNAPQESVHPVLESFPFPVQGQFWPGGLPRLGQLVPPDKARVTSRRNMKNSIYSASNTASLRNQIFFTAPGYSSEFKTQSVEVADVNKDGKLDLLVANECADSVCSNGSIDVFLGNGDGTFQLPMSYSSGGSNAFSAAV